MAEPCIPDKLPLETLDWRTILPLVGHANACLARYDGMLQTLPNPSVLLSPITANEAVLSSKRSEEHPSELQSLMRNSYAVFCLKKKNPQNKPKKLNQ